MKINIAIDGPAGSGKSTIGEILAEKLQYQFIDTGLTYRAFTYYCYQEKVDFTDHHQLATKLAEFSFAMEGKQVYVNGQDVTNFLQTSSVLDNINKITNLEFIRTALVTLQRSLAHDKGVVMVGRDIASVVLPHAELKIYLTADLKVRAMRRWEQNKSQQITPNVYEEIYQQLFDRDSVDLNRNVGALKLVPDAICIDNSNDTMEETVEQIYQLALNRMAGD